MHGVLPREAMRQEDLPAATQLVSFKWKAFDLQGCGRWSHNRAGEQAFVLVTQVPAAARGGAAVLERAGRSGGACQAIMEAILASLEGETNCSPRPNGGAPGHGRGWWIRHRRGGDRRRRVRKRRARSDVTARGTPMTERRTLAILVGGGPAPGNQQW